MRTTKEPNCVFGGMAFPSWESPKDIICKEDNENECSWLFKIESKDGR